MSLLYLHLIMMMMMMIMTMMMMMMMMMIIIIIIIKFYALILYNVVVFLYTSCLHITFSAFAPTDFIYEFCMASLNKLGLSLIRNH
jgi:hypothetical protein